ncbi:hypothetical protein BDA99DRAFT_537688 [Phascolomyces articulosus]|uniref:Uncharacterized protein n=1 Tax=Phascolomyces articulosus TaxID=60185 RepID=A0AAD5KA80_9FUNG|nr:hypothetical protein BDA99DRAFT_537688 [Phascolomyces articulosus]
MYSTSLSSGGIVVIESSMFTRKKTYESCKEYIVAHTINFHNTMLDLIVTVVFTILLLRYLSILSSYIGESKMIFFLFHGLVPFSNLKHGKDNFFQSSIAAKCPGGI